MRAILAIIAGIFGGIFAYVATALIAISTGTKIN